MFIFFTFLYSLTRASSNFSWCFKLRCFCTSCSKFFSKGNFSQQSVMCVGCVCRHKSIKWSLYRYLIWIDVPQFLLKNSHLLFYSYAYCNLCTVFSFNIRNMNASRALWSHLFPFYFVISLLTIKLKNESLIKNWMKEKLSNLFIFKFH